MPTIRLPNGTEYDPARDQIFNEDNGTWEDPGAINRAAIQQAMAQQSGTLAVNPQQPFLNTIGLGVFPHVIDLGDSPASQARPMNISTGDDPTAGTGGGPSNSMDQNQIDAFVKQLQGISGPQGGGGTDQAIINNPGLPTQSISAPGWSPQQLQQVSQLPGLTGGQVTPPAGTPAGGSDPFADFFGLKSAPTVPQVDLGKMPQMAGTFDPGVSNDYFNNLRTLGNNIMGAYDPSNVPTMQAAQFGNVPQVNGASVNAAQYNLGQLPTVNAGNMPAAGMDLSQLPSVNPGSMNAAGMDLSKLPQIAAASAGAAQMDLSRLPSAVGAQSAAAQMDLSKLPTVQAQTPQQFQALQFLLSGQGFDPATLAKMHANATDQTANQGIAQLSAARQAASRAGLLGSGMGVALQEQAAREAAAQQNQASNAIDVQNALQGIQNLQTGAGMELNRQAMGSTMANQIALQNAANIIGGMQTNVQNLQQSGLANQQANQQAMLANVGNQMQGLTLNAQNEQQAGLLNAQLAQQAAIQQAMNAYGAQQFNAGNQQAANLANYQGGLTAGLANAQNAFNAQQFNAANQQAANLANYQGGLTSGLANAQNMMTALGGNVTNQQQANMSNAQLAQQASLANAANMMQALAANQQAAQQAGLTNWTGQQQNAQNRAGALTNAYQTGIGGYNTAALNQAATANQQNAANQMNWNLNQANMNQQANMFNANTTNNRWINSQNNLVNLANGSGGTQAAIGAGNTLGQIQPNSILGAVLGGLR